jgi:hypothetical protein
VYLECLARESIRLFHNARYDLGMSAAAIVIMAT